METKENVEQKVASAVLQKPQDVQIGETVYHVAPPTIATLILVSEAVSTLPHISLADDKIVEEVLYSAKDCRPLGDILAILILGAKNLTEKVIQPKTEEHLYLWGLIRRKHIVEREVLVDRKSELAKRILEEMSPRELNIVISQILSNMQIADFFGITTFLTEVNLLHPREVETTESETTASGQ